MQLLLMKPTPLDPKITDEPDLTEAEIDALLARLQKQCTTSKLIKNTLRTCLKATVRLFPVVLLMNLLFYGSILWQHILVNAMIPTVLISIVISQMYSDRSKILMTHPNRNAPEIVGYCLDVLNMFDVLSAGDGNVLPEVDALLTYFLPRLSAEERHALTARHRSRLNFLLRNKEPRLVSAALQVIAVVGDKNAIWYVENLLKRSKDPAVRVTAQECLVVMQERNALLTDSSILLRASQPVTNRQELLRAATPVSETRPQELLLPADADTQKLVL